LALVALAVQVTASKGAAAFFQPSRLLAADEVETIMRLAYQGEMVVRAAALAQSSTAALAVVMAQAVRVLLADLTSLILPLTVVAVVVLGNLAVTLRLLLQGKAAMGSLRLLPERLQLVVAVVVVVRLVELRARVVLAAAVTAV
jgi:hypothetical protein